MTERTLSEQVRQAYKRGSSGGSDDWHPTVRETHEENIATEISRVLKMTDFADSENLNELSHLLANLFISNAQRQDSIRPGPWD